MSILVVTDALEDAAGTLYHRLEHLRLSSDEAHLVLDWHDLPPAQRVQWYSLASDVVETHNASEAHEEEPSLRRALESAPGWLADLWENALQTWRGIQWTRPYGEEGDGRKPLRVIGGAEAVSSLLEDDPYVPRHTIALDLDVPAALIPSSTPGHSHLYIDVALTWNDYKRLLILLGELEVLEEGYVRASLARRATFLRLPWIRKGMEKADAERALLEWMEREEVTIR